MHAGDMQAHERGNEGEDIVGLIRHQSANRALELFEGPGLDVFIADASPLAEQVDEWMKAEILTNRGAATDEDRCRSQLLMLESLGQESRFSQSGLADDADDCALSLRDGFHRIA